MKKITQLVLILTLFSTTLNAQETFSTLWNKVEKLDKDNLPKSALEIVNIIYNKAAKTNNSPQIVKCLFYKSKYLQVLEEDAQLKIINQFKMHIASSAQPTKSILQNVLANLYWQYFKQNRWKFYKRTQIAVKINPVDFRTWDLNTLFAEIHSQYQASLQYKTQLQKIDVLTLKDILQLVKKSNKYRPTVYDLLAHNALEFYETDETGITKPAYEFKIDNESYIDNVSVFSKLKLITNDNVSLQFNALKIYQDIIQFHIENKNTKALIDADIKRLNFVFKNATFSNKEQLYFKTLKATKKKYNNKGASSLYAYEIARNLQKKAAKNFDKLQFNNREALAICNDMIQRFPESYGAEKCTYLKQQILAKTLRIVTEEFIPVQKDGRVLINYKNIEKLHFSVFKITKKQEESLNKLYQKDKTIFLKKLPKITSWNSVLKNENDYLEHSTEISVPKLPQGNYLIVASSKETISVSSTFGYASIQVTNLALVQNMINGKSIYQVVDRNTGSPIVNASVKFTNRRHARRNTKKINKSFTTDTNGSFSYNSDNYYNIDAIVSYKQEKAVFDNISINRYYKPEKEKKHTSLNTFLFTDRGIYRPGQIVYFKGIVIENNSEKSKVKSNAQVEVFLKDVNYQELKKIHVKTNEFGSFSGEFVLPNTGLTGYFTIQANIEGSRGNTNFSVEEYKRPKFEVEFSAIDKAYKANDLINVSGFTKSFSGVAITNAKVVYNVRRKVQYPQWYYWRRPTSNIAPKEIKNGESTTDDKGNFNITFKALVDELADENTNPIFTYEVSVSVTDVNGETRSTITDIKVGYQSLIASIDIKDVVNTFNKNQTIKIDTKNLNDVFVPVKGVLRVYKLTSPSRVLRKRIWEAPDYQVMSKIDFEKHFPNDAFANEDNFTNWKKGAVVLSVNFDTGKEKEIPLRKLKKWQSGKYVIELNSKDKFNQKVTSKKYFTVVSNDDRLPADNQLISITTDKESYNIGDKAKVTISSNSKDITILFLVEKNQQVIEKKYIHLNKESKTIIIPVEKDDVGGFGISYSFVNYNSFDSGVKTITVPYPKTELDIVATTFRDKLLPGEKQTWSFTIKGTKKDKVFAEVLASMYDASLDEFIAHEWNFKPIDKPIYNGYNNANGRVSFGVSNFRIEQHNTSRNISFPSQNYTQLNWFGFYLSNRQRQRGSMIQKISSRVAKVSIESESVDDSEEVVVTGFSPNNNEKFKAIADKATGSLESSKEEEKKSSSQKVQVRKNLQETAFFYPNLTTDKKGNVTFNFTVPEALTKWKLQLLAHTKELHSATKKLETVTQKELMVIPNAPRFLREGDRITFSSKIANLSTKKLEGIATLVLTDAVTGKEVSILENTTKDQPFTVNSNENTNVSWSLKIPDTVSAVQYKVIAKAGNFSDGEQNVLPVLSNRTLVTETLPMWVRSNKTKTFTLDKLKNNKSNTLKHHKLTLEVTSNPVWYALQALPYLMEYPYDCSEQTFARYYANTLASHIANSNPRIQEVFNAWKSSDALLSNLEKNSELKSLIIQETPWLRDAQSETEQKKRIALLFDLNKMKNEQQNSIRKLEQLQLNNGGFTWFKGGNYPNTYITQYIASGFGHLKHLGVASFDAKTEQMIKRSVKFLDNELLDKYESILKRANKIKAEKGQKEYEEYLNKKHISYFELQYLYMRSFYKNIKVASKTVKAVGFYSKQSVRYWNSFNLYGKGLIALSSYRTGNKRIATTVLKSLRENSITSDELGMYWKSNVAGYYNYQAPIETQALLIEAFSEIEKDIKTIDNLKIWLLKNKQVVQWKTTKSTSEAVYALLLQGNDWASTTELAEVSLGGKKIASTKIAKVEAGTGYFKTSWNGSEILPSMSEVRVTSKGKTISWGSLYWQYFEDLDKITSSETPLKLKKKLFKKVNSDTGKKLIEVTDASILKVGDLLTVRIELRSDRAMEFIHMKDMRASGLEPINVLSKYKWQDGLGYYQSTKDASTNFFFDRLPKGIYVFEYDVRVNNAGRFSNGITTIESMYAPEFKSHSEGIEILVK